MHAELPVSTLFSFLLVLARISGVFIFLPLPGINAGPAAARIVLSLGATLALVSRWPAVPNPSQFGQLCGWILAELALGLCIGVAVAFLIEAFIIAAQLVSAQAGFSYASTIDPTTSADSTVLIVVSQLAATLLFFATGLDRQVLIILANSLETHPPGTFELTRPTVEALAGIGSGVFTTGFRLVLPLLTLLFLVDLSLGLLGRLNSQLQVLSLALPLKILVSMALLSWSVLLFPNVFARLSSAIFGVLRHALGV